ncbi:16S rRNA (uracil(1498)-N(3))-methyltransferase [Kamptonema formosum]|uniref:16S rRNA (uracil(1498)-N(3))-methyltransferase n=1 Tax=Kamptonema formosum TaxID=331992 RepID=UPI00034C94CD|nr:16S rRNA (uracil(1498)-N(3))-methyltransferase [Oscillatoria sp. PCC 10802]
MAQLQRLALAPEQLHNQHIHLTAEQQHYLCRVLRLRDGDRFIAIDCQGQWWLARLHLAAVAPAGAEILERVPAQTELPAGVRLIAALPKGNGFDDVVRQATEIGVTAIAPVLSERTLLDPGTQKIERWRRIAREAAEQSERQVVPAILSPVLFSQALSELAATDVSALYICVARPESPHLLDCLSEQQSLSQVLSASDSNPRPSIVIATGPEGGWTPSEVEGAIAAGFQPVSLGRRILRAVTAPVVALSLVAAVLELQIKN